MFTSYEQIKVQRAQREAFGEQLRIRFQEFLAGRSAGGDGRRDTIDILLEAQRFWADALANEYDAIVKYNNALVNFEFGKGTLLQHNNVVIAEGALPGVAQVRAVEHQRERSKALVLREVSRPVPHEEFVPDAGQVGLPNLPKNDVPSLPALFEKAPGVPANLPAVEGEDLKPAKPAKPGVPVNPMAQPGLSMAPATGVPSAVANRATGALLDLPAAGPSSAMTSSGPGAAREVTPVSARIREEKSSLLNAAVPPVPIGSLLPMVPAQP
jgi:hypothetical protein